MATANSHDSLPLSLSSTLFGTSDSSTSPSGSPASWYDFVAAQNDATAVHTVATMHLPQTLSPSRLDRYVLSSPQPERSQQGNEHAIHKQTNSHEGSNPEPREIARQSVISCGSTYRPSNSDTGNLLWRSWNEVRINIFGLPSNTVTRDLAMWFRDEGIICAIKIFDDPHGFKRRSASIVFR